MDSDYEKELEKYKMNSDIYFIKEYCIDELKLFEIGLKKKNIKEEDEIYESKPELLNIIRRGNTYIQFKENNATHTILIRKGLQKFFEFDRAYSEENLNKIPEHKSSFYSQKIKEIIFKDLEANNPKIKIYKMEKANGENCQISYNKKCGYWFISSKNVCLAVKSETDLKKFQEDQRFSLAVIIAKQWFLNLKDLALKEHGKIDILKKDLENKCLIGEYCGNQNFQHLIKYNEVQIKFYAIVELNSDKTCIPPQQSIDFFKKYSLNVVNINSQYEICQNFNEFNNKLIEIHDEIIKSKISDEGEGGVLYFVKIDENNSESEVISLCKIKTFEYKYWRKLREKFKNIISNRKNDKNIKFNKIKFIKNFKNEINILKKNYRNDKNEKSYFVFADKCYEILEKCINNSENNASLLNDVMQNNCIDLFASVLYSIDKKKEFNLGILREKEILLEYSPNKWYDILEKINISTQSSGETEEKKELNLKRKCDHNIYKDDEDNKKKKKFKKTNQI